MLPRNSGYPNSWKCPISHDVMRDPVIVDASCGHTFERRSIEQWMQQNTGVENMTCPLCRSHLRSQHLAPNVGLRESIDMFYEYPSPSPIATSPLRRFHFRSHHVAANICLRESMEMPYEHPPPSPIGTSRPTEAQQQAVYPFASSNIRAGSMLGRNLSSEDAPLVVYQTVRGKWRADENGGGLVLYPTDSETQLAWKTFRLIPLRYGNHAPTECNAEGKSFVLVEASHYSAAVD
mmetsp:Transcript_8252/g.17597  ORF Transcript_8252/g.17597 Transcript_8252/m.17597 type:complete len:235 (+) Transcript_8252:434-1138(+)